MSISEIRIGQYRFSKNLGNGSFGKVKSKLPKPSHSHHFSGFSRANRSQGCYKNFKQEKNSSIRSFRESQKRIKDPEKIQ